MRGLAGKGFQQARFPCCSANPRRARGRSRGRDARAHAEEIVEDIREGRGEVGAEAVGRAAAAMLECGVAETVVGCALVGVLEDLVGLVDLLEAVLGPVVTGIAIRVTLHRLLAKRGS